MVDGHHGRAPKKGIGSLSGIKKDVISSTTLSMMKTGAGGERLVVVIIVVGETGGSGNAMGVIVQGGRKEWGGVGPSLTKLLSEGEGEGEGGE